MICQKISESRPSFEDYALQILQMTGVLAAGS